MTAHYAATHGLDVVGAASNMNPSKELWGRFTMNIMMTANCAANSSYKAETMSDTDLFLLSDSNIVRNGLQVMLETLCPIDSYTAELWTKPWVMVAPTLFLIEIAKRAEDKEEFFPPSLYP